MGLTEIPLGGTVHRIHANLKRIQQHRWIAVGVLLIVLLLAYQGHRAFQATEFWIGMRYLGLGSLLLIIFTPFVPSRPYPDKRRIGLASGWRRVVGVIGLLIGFGLIVFAGFEFWQVRSGMYPSQVTWNQFVLGMLIWLGGGVLVSCGIPKKITIDQTTGALLQFLVILAIFLRVYKIESLPFGVWFDESLAMLDARRMLAFENYRPFFVPNITYPHLMLYAQALRLFGETNVAGPRLIHAFFGVAAVISAFLVGDLLRGRWFGLLMAFFMAAFSWAITFSRLAMTGIETCFFTLLAFYFLMRMARYGQLRDGLWAGLTVGVGLYFYAAFRFALFPLAIYGLVAWRWWRPHSLFVTLFGGMTAFLVFVPMLIFAQLEPELYTDRSKHVTIFRAENRSGLTLDEALDISIEKHLRMFHVQGDNNGRHNLPNDPMLDAITGVVFVLGIGLSLRRVRHAEEWFFGGLMVVSMAAGILTVHFEAPQALRTIGVLPAIAYFSALTIEEVGQILVKAKLRPLAVVFVAVFLGATLYLNYDKYFERQAHTWEVWFDHSTTGTIVGQLVKARPDNRMFVSPLMFGEPSTEFLVPNYQEQLVLLSYPDTLPLRIPPTGPASIVLDGSEGAVFEYAKVLYPNARYMIVNGSDYEVKGPAANAPVMYVLDLSPADIAAIQGLDENGAGVIYAPQYSLYGFFTGGQLRIDGEPWQSGEMRPLAEGNHAIQITPGQTLEWEVIGYTGRENVPAWMLYRAPISNNGLHGYFYPNSEWAGSPVLERIDPFINIYFHRIPMERPYSVIWKGFIDIPSDGTYRIGLRAISSGEIMIDGALVVHSNSEPSPIFAQIEMKAGRHPIEVRFVDADGYSRIHMLWSQNGGAYEPIPREVLTPN